MSTTHTSTNTSTTTKTEVSSASPTTAGAKGMDLRTRNVPQIINKKSNLKNDNHSTTSPTASDNNNNKKRSAPASKIPLPKARGGSNSNSRISPAQNNKLNNKTPTTTPSTATNKTPTASSNSTKNSEKMKSSLASSSDTSSPLLTAPTGASSAKPKDSSLSNKNNNNQQSRNNNNHNRKWDEAVTTASGTAAKQETRIPFASPSNHTTQSDTKTRHPSSRGGGPNCQSKTSTTAKPFVLEQATLHHDQVQSERCIDALRAATEKLAAGVSTPQQGAMEKQISSSKPPSILEQISFLDGQVDSESHYDALLAMAAARSTPQKIKQEQTDIPNSSLATPRAPPLPIEPDTPLNNDTPASLSMSKLECSSLHDGCILSPEELAQRLAAKSSTPHTPSAAIVTITTATTANQGTSLRERASFFAKKKVNVRTEMARRLESAASPDHEPAATNMCVVSQEYKENEVETTAAVSSLDQVQLSAIKALQQERNKLQNELKESRASMASMKKQIDTLKIALQDMAQEKYAIQQDRNKTKATLTDVKSSRDSLRTALDDAKGQNQDLSVQLCQLQKDLTEARRSIKWATRNMNATAYELEEKGHVATQALVATVPQEIVPGELESKQQKDSSTMAPELDQAQELLSRKAKELALTVSRLTDEKKKLVAELAAARQREEVANVRAAELTKEMHDAWNRAQELEKAKAELEKATATIENLAESALTTNQQRHEGLTSTNPAELVQTSNGPSEQSQQEIFEKALAKLQSARASAKESGEQARKAEGDLEQAISTARKLTQRAEKAEADLAQATAALKKFVKEKHAWEQEHSKFKANLTDMRSSRDSLRTSLDESKARNNELSSQVDELRKKLNEAVAACNLSQSQLSAAHGALEKFQIDKSLLLEQVEMLSRECDNAQNEVVAVRYELEQELAQATAQINQFKQQLEELLQSRDEAEAKLTQLKEELKISVQSKTKAEANANWASAEKAAIKQQVFLMQAEISILKVKIADTNAGLERQHSALKASEQSRNDLLGGLGTLQSNLDTAACLEQEIADKSSTLGNALLSSNKTPQQSEALLQETRIDLISDLDFANAESSHLQLECDVPGELLQTSETEKAGVGKSLNSLQGKLKLKISGLQAAFDKSEQTAFAASKERDELQAELAVAKEQIRDLSVKRNIATGAREKLNETLAEQLTKMERLSAKKTGWLEEWDLSKAEISLLLDKVNTPSADCDINFSTSVTVSLQEQQFRSPDFKDYEVAAMASKMRHWLWALLAAAFFFGAAGYYFGDRLEIIHKEIQPGILPESSWSFSFSNCIGSRGSNHAGFVNKPLVQTSASMETEDDSGTGTSEQSETESLAAATPLWSNSINPDIVAGDYQPDSPAISDVANTTGSQAPGNNGDRTFFNESSWISEGDHGVVSDSEQYTKSDFSGNGGDEMFLDDLPSHIEEDKAAANDSEQYTKSFVSGNVCDQKYTDEPIPISEEDQEAHSDFEKHPKSFFLDKAGDQKYANKFYYQSARTTRRHPQTEKYTKYFVPGNVCSPKDLDESQLIGKQDQEAPSDSELYTPKLLSQASDTSPLCIEIRRQHLVQKAD